MNIFVLDSNPYKAATYHCDQHVIKMILESAQMLCTVAQAHGIPAPYKVTHAKHPCTLWVGQSADNWHWLVELARGLNDEYQKRFQSLTPHKSWKVIEQLSCPVTLPSCGLTPFAQAMPEKYRNPCDPVAAYREFYKGEKRAFASWTKGTTPEWFSNSECGKVSPS